MKSWRWLLAALAVLLLVSGGSLLARADAVQLNADNNNQTVSLGQGAVVELSLPGNPTTGYSWSFAEAPDQSVLAETSHFYISPSQAIGSGGDEHWVFRAVGAGTTQINLAYSRPWEKDTPPVKTYAVAVGVNAAQAPAPSPSNQASFTVGSNSFSVNGQVYQMDAGVSPFLQDGRVYVPVRYLVQALSLSTADMYWNEADGSVVLPPDQDGTVYHLKIGDHNIYQLDSGGTDKVVKAMDAAPLDKDGRIYLPARFVTGLYGYQAGWDAAGGMLSIEAAN
jgi:predicted secreted protein